MRFSRILLHRQVFGEDFAQHGILYLAEISTHTESAPVRDVLSDPNHRCVFHKTLNDGRALVNTDRL